VGKDTKKWFVQSDTDTQLSVLGGKNILMQHNWFNTKNAEAMKIT
jgi:hypothetical protein